MPNKRAISIRVLKEHFANPPDALKDGHRLQEVALSDAPDNKRLFAGQAYRRPAGIPKFSILAIASRVWPPQ
jgi:hypothetical protein